MFNRNSPDALICAAHVNLPPTDCLGAFESEAMPHLNDLYRAALHMLQRSATASEAVHETYLRAGRVFGEYPRAMACKTWLFQILFDVIHRHSQRQSTQLQEPKFLPNAQDLVVSAMNRVPPDFREALLLIDCHGFSYREAAEILGLSADVVARRIVLGRNHLYSELEACRSTLVSAAH